MDQKEKERQEEIQVISVVETDPTSKHCTITVSGSEPLFI